MTGLTDAEQEQIPNHAEVESVSRHEFKIHEVKTGKQVLWIEDLRGFHISFILDHIDPDSDLGQKVKTLPDNDYVTMSGVRLTKSVDHMPRWYLTEITDLRSSEGPERNAFR